MTRACTSFAVWAVAACVALLSPAALAADGSWNLNNAGNWSSTGSWLDGVVPGSTTTTDSTDIATFGFTLTVARGVTVDANRNVGGITFSNTSAFGYSLNTGALRLSDGGVIQTAADNGAHTDTISSAIAIQGDGGSATFTAGATNSASLLVIAGGASSITGVSTAGNTTTLTLNGGNTGLNTVSGNIVNGSGGGRLAVVKSGSGRWMLSSNNTFSGGLTLNDGTLVVGAATAFGTGTFTITGGAIDVNANWTMSANNVQAWNGDFSFLGTNTLNLGTGAVTLNGNRTVTVNASTLTVGGAIGDGGLGYGLTKSGTGGLTLSGANTYSGDTTISAGTLTASNAAALGSGTAGLNVNGGTLSIGTGINIARTGAITLAGGTISTGTLTNNGSALDARSGAISSVLAGTGGVSKTTADTVTLSGNNTFFGGVTLSAGTLRLGGTAALGSGTFTIAGGSLDSSVANLSTPTNNPQAWNGDFTFVGTNNLTLGGVTSVGGAVTLSGNRTITVDANMLTVQGAIGDGGSGYGITKNGAGELRINGTNTFTGTTTINEGTLSFYQDFNLSGTASPLVFNGGGLHISGTNLTSLNPNRPTTFTSGKTVSLGSQTSLTVSQKLNQGTGGLTITGGSVIPTASNTYTGTTTINSGGTLVISSDANLSGTNSPLVFNGGALQINGTTLTTLNQDRPTTFTSGTTIGFNVNTSTHTFTVGQTLNQGTGGLTKAGNGTLSLDAANTYTGVTTVSAGVLLLNNANALPGGVGATGGTSNLTLAGGVVGLTSDFSRSIGTSGSQVQWSAAGGWAAYGADRTVNLGGNETPSTIVWGNTIANGGFNGLGLILGGSAATHTVELVNGLNLGSGNRTVTVNNGTAAIDAKFSGSIIGSGTLTNAGSGLLLITGNNTSFTGRTVIGGVVAISNANALGSGTVQLNNLGSLASTSATPLTLANPVVVNTSVTLGNAAATGDLVLAGGLTPSGAITLTGLSSVNVTGTVSGVGGDFRVPAGKTLRLGADNSAWSGTKYLQGPGTYVLGHAKALGSGTIQLGDNNSNLSYALIESEVDLTGPNALTNTFVIPRITGGFGLVVGGGFGGTNSIELAGGVIFDVRLRGLTNYISGGSLLISGNVSGVVGSEAATPTLIGTGNTTISGNIVNGGAPTLNFVVQSTGITTFSGTNTYNGTTTVNAGALLLSTTSAISGAAARPYSVPAAGSVGTGFALDQAFLDRVATNAAGAIALGADSANDLNFTSINNASLGAIGSGTWAYSGTLTPNGTTYRLGGGGGTLDFQSPLTDGTSARTLTVGGDVTGLGGTVLLSNTTNSYGGATTVQRGILQVASLANAGSNSPTGTNATINLSSGTSVGTLRYVGSGHSSNRTISIQGTVGGVIDASGPGALNMASGTISAAANTTVTLTGTSTANNTIGMIAGSGVSVNKTGPGLWRLSGANTFTGPGQFSVLDGTLVAAAASAFGTSNDDPIIGSSAAGVTGTVSLFSEGVSGLRGFTVPALGEGSTQAIVIGGVNTTGTAGFSGTIKLGRGVTLQAATGGAVQFDGTWQGLTGTASTPAVPITIGSEGNAGTVILGSALPASITSVSIVRGTARLNDLNNDRINPATPVTIGSAGGPATLDINGQSQGLSRLTFAGDGSTVTNGTLRLVNSATVTAGGTGHTISSLVALESAAEFAVNSASRLTISSSISGAGFGLTKTGAGTLNLTGTSSYSGATTVSAGSLLVNGRLSNSDVTVQSGGLLGGSGTLIGSVSVLAGGVLSPGNSPGLLATGSLTLAGTTLMEIDGLSPRGGIGGFDAVDVTGPLTYGGSLVIDFGDLITSALDNDTSFKLFDFASPSNQFSGITTANDGSWYGNLTFASTGSGDKWTAEKGSQTLEFTHSTGILVIVPEPAAIALAGIGIAAAAWAARRRRACPNVPGLRRELARVGFEKPRWLKPKEGQSRAVNATVVLSRWNRMHPDERDIQQVRDFAAKLGTASRVS